MVQKHNRVVTFPRAKVIDENSISARVQAMKARREAGLPIFAEPDKNEPEWAAPCGKPVYPMHEKCGHPLDGNVKWTRGEFTYCSETVGGQPGYKSSLVPCSHCTEEQRKIHGERVMKSRLSAECNIPAYTNNSTWDSLPKGMDTAVRNQVHTATLSNIAAIRLGGKGENLLIYGDPQLGKTTLASLAAREYIKAGVGVYFTAMRSYTRTLRQEMHKDVEQSVEDVVLNAPVLILDDLGAEDGSKWEIGKIFDLIEYRLTKGYTTFITSNNSPAALRKKWSAVATDPEVQDQGGRIVERLIKHYTPVEVL